MPYAGFGKLVEIYLGIDIKVRFNHLNVQTNSLI